MPLTDAFGRKHDYLRISVTDRCNLRCLYCMGEEGVEEIKHSSVLRYEEILKVVAAGAELGISKIRITGGEPLVRRNVVDLFKMISTVPGIKDLSMTTNGILLPRFAAKLKKAGLQRVNISLDSLDPGKYKQVTRCGSLDQALAGIEASLTAGLHPVKINVVLMKGINDHEVTDFLELAQQKDLQVRFIEYMPIGNHDSDYAKRYLPLDYVLKKAAEGGLPLTPLVVPGGAGPAESYSVPGGRGIVGLIHPISKHFCHSCNRLRLTADGHLKACLYWQKERPVRPIIDDHKAIQDLIKTVLKEKPAEHRMTGNKLCGTVDGSDMRVMSQTGG